MCELKDCVKIPNGSNTYDHHVSQAISIATSFVTKMYKVETSAPACLLLALHMVVTSKRYRQQAQHSNNTTQSKHTIQVVLEYIHSARILSIPRQRNNHTRQKGC